MATYMTAKEVAAKIKLSEQTIRRYTMLRQIPFHKLKRAVRYKESEIEKWVEDRETGIAGKQNTDLTADLFVDCGKADQPGNIASGGVVVSVGGVHD